MRFIPGTTDGTPISSVGFGCASLGSRVSARESLNALARAFDAGVTWFDVAPSYGDGHAESILGEFARNRRQSIHICTKVGIVAQSAGWKKLVRPLARNIVGRFPSTRKFATRARAVTKLPLVPAALAESVEQSLRKLNVEHIDMLMLHDPNPNDVIRDDIVETLAKLKVAGKIAAAGVAGGLEATLLAANHPHAIYSAVQFSNNPLGPTLANEGLIAWRRAGKLVITHSALGSGGAMATITTLLSRDASARRLLADGGYDLGTLTAAASDFLIDYALATNDAGVSLFSVVQSHHLDSLTSRMSRDRDKATLMELGNTLFDILENSNEY